MGEDTVSQENEGVESEYYSARIESMISSSRRSTTEGVELDVEFSKVHWTEQEFSDCEEDLGTESDREYFEMLKKPFEGSSYYSFFREFENLVVGEKIAEGGQGEVYEAILVNEGRPDDKSVVKVFKRGFSLRYFESQCPDEVFSWVWFGGYNPEGIDETLLTPADWIQGGTLLEDDRFAMVMWRQWGDLRKLIDMRMVVGRRPPFSYGQVMRLMWCIAQDMEKLHDAFGIIHKDLKASNVLVRPWDYENVDIHGDYQFSTIVSDFECSVGVVGTTFWRPPEILQQLRNGVSICDIEFTTKGDVYSYGMTCYEIVTGCIPFEDHSPRDYDVIFSGKRPMLPKDINPLVEDIITSCWHVDPLQRPTFRDILDEISREHP